MKPTCGREQCQGPKKCSNFGEHGCKGINWDLPPWSTTERLERLQQIFNEKMQQPKTLGK